MDLGTVSGTLQNLPLKTVSVNLIYKRTITTEPHKLAKKNTEIFFQMLFGISIVVLGHYLFQM